MADEKITIEVDMQTQDAVSSLAELENKIKEVVGKTGEKSSRRLGIEKQLTDAVTKAKELSSTINRLSAGKTVTPEYSKLLDKFDQAQKRYNEAFNEYVKQQQDIAGSNVHSLESLEEGFKRNKAEGQALTQVLEDISADLQALEDAGKHEFLDTASLDKANASYDELIKKINILIAKEQELSAAENKSSAAGSGRQSSPYRRHLLSVAQVMHIIDNAVRSTAQLFKRAFDTMINIAQRLANVLKNVARVLKDAFITSLKTALSVIKKFSRLAVTAFKGIVTGAKRAASAMKFNRKETEKTSNSFKDLLKMVLQYGLGIRSLYFLFRKMRSWVSDGFGYLVNASDEFSTTIETIKGAFDTLKLAITGAFKPLVDFALPYIIKIAHVLADAIGYVSQFIAALTGKDTYMKAKWQTQSLEKSEKDLQEQMEETTKAANKQLAGFDELNNLTTTSQSDKLDKDDIHLPYDMLWEDVAVDNKIKDLVDKIKKMIADLLDPLKKAWAKWKDTILADLKDLWKWVKQLASDFWRDFIKVWKGPTMAKVFDNLFAIADNIIKTLRNLFRQFDIAWNTNDVGLHILEDIADILEIITRHARNISEEFVKWSDSLDFYPLLQAIEDWLKSIQPLVEFICQAIEDFVSIVFLPFLKYLIEVGIPKIFDAFTEFNKKVNWERLTELVKRFWTALEPLLELSFEALIKGLSKLLDIFADFLNGGFIPEFVEDFEELVAALQRAKGPMDVIDAIFDFFNKRIEQWILLLNNFMADIENFLFEFQSIDPTTMTSPLKRLAEDVDNIINTILKKFDFGLAAKTISMAIKDLFEFIATTIEGIDKSAVENAVYSFLMGIDWIGIFDKVGKFIAASAELIKAIGSGILKAIKESIGEVTPEALADKINQLVDTLHTFITNAIDKIPFEEIGHYIGKLLANINWSQIWNDLKEDFGKLASGFGAMLKAIFEEDPELKTNLEKAIDALFSWFASIVVTKIGIKLGEAVIIGGIRGAFEGSIIAGATGAALSGEVEAAATGLGAGTIGIVAVAIAAGVYSIIESFGGLAGVFEKLAEIFKPVIDKFKEMADEGGAIDRLKDAFGRLLDSLGNLSGYWELYFMTIEYYIELLMPIIEILISVLAAFIDIVGAVIDIIGGLAQAIVDVFKGDFARIPDDIGDVCSKVLEHFKKLKYDLIGDPVVLDIRDGVIKAFIDLITGVIKAFTNNDFVKKICGFFEDIYNGIVEKFKDIPEKLRKLLDEVIQAVEEFKDTVKRKIEEYWEKLKEKFESAKNYIKEEIIDKIIEFFDGMVDKIEAAGASAAEKFGNAISTVIDVAKTIVETVIGLFEGVGEAISNTLKTAAETAASFVEGALNSAIEAINSVAETAAETSAKASNKSSWSWKVLGKIALPHFATGTVVPPSMSPFLGVLGDNNKETEVVSPLSTMRQAMLEALESAGFNGRNTGDIVVEIDGYEVFRAVQDQNRIYKKSTGLSAF